MLTPVWQSITLLGDSAVLLPCVTLMMLWLFMWERSRALARRWLLLLTVVVGAVMASKLAFVAWGIGIPELDFIGLSGHSAMAAVIWPSLLSLLLGGLGRTWRHFGVFAGLALALLIGVSRVELHAHSASEVVLGLLLGACAAIIFLRQLGEDWCLSGPSYLGMSLPLLLLLLLLPWFYGYRFPSELLLRAVAQHLKTGGTLHTRGDLTDHLD